ncbi:hypothetical protein [Riemerella columbipharyngis]|uniref:Uncharacterized protein n=1 Tax=Riemerella columbipharyngis TaxID=1071918 RepID=A0A1G7FMK7_9FLAO|nr:hypothetical protein [Riemerella columbipharyngis]SDE77130.1 hypothetical protein SAMN05421544_12423 [Riemerella columbipharyngis]
MSKALQDALRALGKRGVDTFPAQVVSVDKNAGTCTVNDGVLDYTDVRLSAGIEAGAKRYFIFPKVGSWVLVSPIQEDLHNLYVEAVSEVESIELKIEGVELGINPDGFLLKKENETLKTLMVDLLEAIKRMKFTTNMGPTIKLINEAEFTAIENRFKTFLKDN